METTIVKISQIALNEGQVPGLPNNPRLIKNKEFELMKELDAYDELDESLTLWFWNKYQAQETATTEE